MKINFVPIDYDYFDWQGRNYVKIVGRDEKGKRICVVDTCPVYFWAILKDGLNDAKTKKLIGKIGKIKLSVKGRGTRVEKVELHNKNFLGRSVKALKIFATNYKDLHDIASELGMKEIEKRRGYDLGFVTHYIIEKKIVPMHWYEVSGELLDHTDKFGGIGIHLDVDICLELGSFKEIEERKFQPKFLAYDIETDELKIGEGEILMISLVSDNFKKVLTWKKTSHSKQDYVEYVKDEAELLEKFVEYVRKISPDFLVGYFSDGFDLPYLKARAEKHRVKLSLSLDGAQPKFSRGITMTGKTNGIVHLDILKFIRTAYSQYMQSETLSLNEVANEFLGDRKKSFEFKHSSKMGDDWGFYYEYNLHDSVLVFKLFEKMWPDVLEFSRIMQEPISEVSRNGMSKNVESYILHNLGRFNEIPEKRPSHDEISERRMKGKYEGAFVFEPIPGLYENIGMFDFTASYGSTIVTFNLSRSTFLENPEKNSYSVETMGRKLHFSKKSGFFPEMLRELIEKRKQFKKELKQKPDVIKKARSNAFKLLANASYGYQGFFGARYYSYESASATAAFAKKAIKDMIKLIDKEGYKTIYSDTDSIAFLLNKKSEKQTLEFLGKLNSKLPGIMELELEDFFKRGLWVTKRSGTFGAKKKYALIDKNGRVKIRGFETVRRDWCALARKVQNKVLNLVLKEGNEKKSLEFVLGIVKKVKFREIDKSELIIKTQLKKPLSEYKAISPHVVAARKMQQAKIPISEGNLVEYYISETKEKKKLVRDKVKLPDEKGEYDIEYYLKNQILPAVENIFQVFDIDINDLINSKNQGKLHKWF